MTDFRFSDTMGPTGRMLVAHLSAAGITLAAIGALLGFVGVWTVAAELELGGLGVLYAFVASSVGLVIGIVAGGIAGFAAGSAAAAVFRITRSLRGARGAGLAGVTLPAAMLAAGGAWSFGAAWWLAGLVAVAAVAVAGWLALWAWRRYVTGG